MERERGVEEVGRGEEEADGRDGSDRAGEPGREARAAAGHCGGHGEE